MARTYPDALIGYDKDIERKYRANPAAFHQAVITARHAPAAPAAAARPSPQVTGEPAEQAAVYLKVKIARWHLMPSGNFLGKIYFCASFSAFSANAIILLYVSSLRSCSTLQASLAATSGSTPNATKKAVSLRWRP